MFENIGEKIKNYARALMVAGIVAGIIGGIVYLVMKAAAMEYSLPDDIGFLLGDILVAVAIAMGGFWGVRLVAYLLYGFGQLVDNSDRMAELLDEANDMIYDGNARETATSSPAKEDPAKAQLQQALKRLHTLYQNGSITEQDYQQKRKRLLEQYHQYG